MRFKIRFHFAGIIFGMYHNPVTIFRVTRKMLQIRHQFLQGQEIKKIAFVDGKYYFDLFTPAFGSRAFRHFIEGEANRIAPIPGKFNHFANIFVAVTKSCPLNCPHCLEGDSLNQPDLLTLEDLKKLFQNIDKVGTAQIQLTGGEPLLRLNDIIEILKAHGKETEFWLYTSGYKLTASSALTLKQAGLSGIALSLDHWSAESHNNFRGNKDSFQWVEEAVQYAMEAKLVVALSICVSRAFVTEDNLLSYIELAKEWGVSFIQLLEPKASGRYAGKDIELKPAQEKILEDFFLKMNFHPAYHDYPIVTYHGYYQRKAGCLCAGRKSFYIDADANIHACPFCRGKMGSALDGDIIKITMALQSKGCSMYKAFPS